MRRKSAILVMATAVSAMNAGTAWGGDWPQFLGLARDGSADDETIALEVPAAGFPILWRVPAGQGYAGTAVLAGEVILFHQPADEEVAVSLHADTGKEIWQAGYPSNYQGGYGTGPGPRSTPAITSDSVFTFGATGVLQALDRKTGAVRWRRDLGKEFALPEGFFGVGTSPLIDGTQLLMTVGAPKASLVAFDQATGKILWNASQDEASYASPTLAEIDGKKRALFFARTGLHVVDPASGEEIAFFRWRARMNASVNAATPVVAGSRIFLSAEYGTGAVLLSLSGSQLTPLWQGLESLSCHYDTPVLYDGHLYGIDGRQEFGASLRCTRLDDGKVAWTQEGTGCASIIRVKDRLILVTESGELIFVDADPKGHRERGRQRIGRSPTQAAPALAHGVLYVRTPDELVAIRVAP